MWIFRAMTAGRGDPVLLFPPLTVPASVRPLTAWPAVISGAVAIRVWQGVGHAADQNHALAAWLPARWSKQGPSDELF